MGTSDGKLAALHMRTMPLLGFNDTKPWHHTLDELVAAGAAPLESAIAEATGAGALVIVDVKGFGSAIASNQPFVDSVIGAMDGGKCFEHTGRCTLTSRDDAILEAALGMNESLSVMEVVDVGDARYGRLPGARAMTVNWQRISLWEVKHAKSGGKSLAVFVANGERDFWRALAFSVDWIVTDNPVRARAMVGQALDACVTRGDL